jgi:exopolysaccharide biosynthesis polyprenyl glycosylphosphotransferase
MSILSRKTPYILLVGDLVSFALSLWVALFVRYGALPEQGVFLEHLAPFSILFVVWVGVYFIAGLYEQKTAVIKSNLSQRLLYVQFLNVALAAVFFYFATFTSLAPKTNLVVYLVVSAAIAFFWRRVLYPALSIRKREQAILVGRGPEVSELHREINGNSRYPFEFVLFVNLDSADAAKARAELAAKVSGNSVSAIVVDFYDAKAQEMLPELYELLFAKVRFVDMHKVYEDVFGRVALSLLSHGWFLENVSAYPKYVYDALKRVMDFAIALCLGAVSLVVYPFVFLAIKLEDRGPVFIMQERVGRDGTIIRIPKFRSMKSSDKGVWVKENDNRITRVGKLLRTSRIDELPQLLSVLKGDMSLVGPRPDIKALGAELSAQIPYYAMRSIIKPGLSGWAQTRQELPPQSLEETKMRLAYDFYYIKYRSLFLDLKIALQTLATLASRMGK